MTTTKVSSNAVRAEALVAASLPLRREGDLRTLDLRPAEEIVDEIVAAGDHEAPRPTGESEAASCERLLDRPTGKLADNAWNLAAEAETEGATWIASEARALAR